MGLKRAFVWTGLAQGCTFVLQFAASVVLARLLSPVEMGIYAVAAATLGALSIMHALGLQSFIVRETDLTEEKIATAFTFNGLICIALSAATFALSIVGGRFLGDSGVSHVLMALALNPLFGIFDFLPISFLQREGRFKEISIATTVSGFVTTIFTIGLAYLGFRYMSIAYAQWAGLAVNAALVSRLGRSYVRFDVGFKGGRRIGDFGLQMLAISGITSLSQRISDIVLGRLLGLAALGLYNRASSLNTLIWTNVHTIAGKVVFADFAHLHRRGVSLRQSYMRTVTMVTALLWPAFAGLALLAAPFIRNVYGENWLPAAPAFCLLAIASIVQVSITMTWELFAACGNLRAQSRIEFIRTLLSLGMFVAGCAFGLKAAAATRVLDAIVAVFLYRPYVDRMTDTSVQDFLPIYRQSAILTAIAIGPAFVLMACFRFDAAVPLWLCLGAVTSGVALWCAGLFASRHPLAEEIAGLTTAARRSLIARFSDVKIR